METQMEENCGLSVEINKRLLNKPDATVDAVLKVMLMKLYKFTYLLSLRKVLEGNLVS